MMSDHLARAETAEESVRQLQSEVAELRRDLAFHKSVNNAMEHAMTMFSEGLANMVNDARESRNGSD